MSSVSQLVPNYVLGISDQPDELKRPGQVRESINTFPDVTFGLTKRPGLDYIKTINLPTKLDSTPDSGNGSWFSYFRTNEGIGREEYFGYISQQGKVKIWSAKTGTEMNVNYLKTIVPVPSSTFSLPDASTSTAPKFGASLVQVSDDDMIKPTDPNYDQAYVPYLIHQNRKSIKNLTINDYTFLANREISATISGSTADVPTFEAFIDIRTLAYNRDYTIAFNEPGASSGVTNVTTATSVDLLGSSFPSYGTTCYSGTETLTINHPTDTSKTGLRINFTTYCQNIASEGPDGYWVNHATSLTLLSGGSGWEIGDTVTVTTSYGATCKVRVDEIGTASYKASIGVATEASPASATTTISVQNLIGTLPDPTASPAVVGSGLLKEIYDLGGWDTIEQIGNGIYITRSTAFTVDTPEYDLFNILSLNKSDSNTAYMATDNISSLPTQCKHNVICKVLNSGSSSDDYFVRFQGDLNQDGRGVWEETRQPGLNNTFNVGTMPHQIVRMSTVDLTDPNDPIVTFLVSDVDYDSRQVGDTNTNLEPSFVGKPINNVMFFRNRLIFLSDESVVMSRPGDYFNFWAVSAIAASPKDPIDVSAATTYASVLYDGITINNGLVLFSEFQQFLLTTDSDVLDNSTVKVTPIGSYNFSKLGTPFRMGGTFGWIGTETNFSKFNEMSEVFREGEPNVQENSTIIKKRFIGEQVEIASSKESGITMFSEYQSKNIFFYRFFNNGNERVLSSWSQWVLPDPLQFHTIIGDNYCAVTKDANNQYHFIQLSIREGFLGQTSLGIPFVYPVALDYKAIVPKESVTFDSNTRTSTFTSTIPIKDIEPVVLSTDHGRYGKPTKDTSGTTLTLVGDWSDSDLYVGYTVPCKISLPTFYVQQQQQNRVKSELTKDLIIHRAKFSFGDVGYYSIDLKRLGMDNYTFDNEFTYTDLYKADADYVVTEVQSTVPIYTRNKSFDVDITSDHPCPFILFSMTWEGDFTNNYYKSV